MQEENNDDSKANQNNLNLEHSKVSSHVKSIKNGHQNHDDQ